MLKKRWSCRCQRLGLVSLAYLWQRDQSELLEEMIQSGLESILIKVASIGLESSHLNQSLGQMQPKLEALVSQILWVIDKLAYSGLTRWLTRYSTPDSVFMFVAKVVNMRPSPSTVQFLNLRSICEWMYWDIWSWISIFCGGLRLFFSVGNVVAKKANPNSRSSWELTNGSSGLSKIVFSYLVTQDRHRGNRGSQDPPSFGPWLTDNIGSFDPSK